MDLVEVDAFTKLNPYHQIARTQKCDRNKDVAPMVPVKSTVKHEVKVDLAMIVRLTRCLNVDDQPRGPDQRVSQI
jgi:hypothetical protein